MNKGMLLIYTLTMFFIGYGIGYKKSDKDFMKQWNSLNWKSF